MHERVGPKRGRNSRGIHDSSPFSGFDLDFPLSHPSLYHACDLWGGGGGNRTPARLENRSNDGEGGLRTFSATKIYPSWKRPLFVSLIPPLTHASSSTRYNARCSSFSSRFSWCRHTPDAYVATTRATNLRYGYLYPVAEISSLKTVRFFFLFSLESRFGEKDRRPGWTILVI